MIQVTGAILRGQKKPSRRILIDSFGVRAIRERTSLSQPEFAQLICVSVKTPQNWEQDRRRPTGPAAALLTIIARDSEGDPPGVGSRQARAAIEDGTWLPDPSAWMHTQSTSYPAHRASNNLVAFPRSGHPQPGTQ